MDGLLIVDKPVGPTSHDVVARARRALREQRIGHTGTLDPLASGLLLLLIGRATRLAQFLSADAKRYEATIRLGFSTDTYDSLGRPSSTPHPGDLPTREQIEIALNAFRGTFEQQPPAFSAKKIEGKRSYRLARAARDHRRDLSAPPALPAPATVTVERLVLLGVEAAVLRLDLTCSSGFYVRSLAHDLGGALGVGAHLAALRRTEAGGRTVEEAMPLSAIDEPGQGLARAQQALIPLADALPKIPALILTDEAVNRTIAGRDISALDLADLGSTGRGPLPPRARLLTEARELVCIAELTPAGLLHPVVVLM